MFTWLQSLSERLTGHRLLDTRAIAVLMQELKSGKRRCIRRNDWTGKPERVPRTFWNDHEIDGRSGFVQIYRGPRGPHGYNPHNCIQGWLYFVWPDLDLQAEQVSREVTPQSKTAPKKRIQARRPSIKPEAVLSLIKEKYRGLSWREILQKTGGRDGLKKAIKDALHYDVSSTTIDRVRTKFLKTSSPKKSPNTTK
jgi:hypothetical protein